MKTKILLALSIFISLNSFAQLEANVIRVQGNSIISEVPELMIVRITIISEDSIYSKCSEKLISNYNQIEKSFAKNGISKGELKSEGVNIDKKYSWQDKGRVEDGYQGTISADLKLQYSAENLKMVMKTLGNKLINFSYNISFDLSNEQKDKLLQQAIELAVKDAKSKAEYIAKSLNVELREIKDVNFGHSNGYGDLLRKNNEVYFVAEDSNSMSKEGINLNPKKVSVEKSIDIVWNISQ